MKEKLIRFLTSYKAAIVLLAAYAFLMGIATFIEKEYSTNTAKTLIYYSPTFILLHLLMILNFIGISIKKKYLTLRKWGYAGVHLAFIIILMGAMTTHLFSKEGMLHLREGEKSNIILIKQGENQHLEELPFEVELLDFKLTRYPGSHSPSSYESLLKLYTSQKTFEHNVYMNHVLDLEGYRFFQASYDPDEHGTILSVSYDVAGRTITYIGYALLFIGFIGCFTARHSRFRLLYNQLNTLRTLIVVFFLGISVSLNAQTSHINGSHAELFGKLPMQDFHGRIIPINTFASELVRKLQLDKSIKEEDENVILLEFITQPTKWANLPIIKVDDKEIRKQFTEGKDFISYVEAFTKQGEYKWEVDIENIYQKNPNHRSRLERELLKLDEKINLLHQIFNYRLLRIFPIPNDSTTHLWIAAGDEKDMLTADQSKVILNLFNHYKTEIQDAISTGKWNKANKALEDIQQYQEKHYSGLNVDHKKIELEVKYNQLNLFPFIQKVYLIVGAILLILSILSWTNNDKIHAFKIVKNILLLAIIVSFCLHTYCIGLRGVISGHAPWSNSYETMVFLSWAAVIGGICFIKRNEMAFALSTIFGGIVLFVSGLNWMDPEITPLVPVLKSPWLMFHVATLMMAYGFLGISCMMGTTNLITMNLLNDKNSKQMSHHIKKLSIISELSLCIGLALMTIGIFLGAIWANESWGRYWSWDPKETWALITTIIYAIVLHIRWFEKKNNYIRFNILSQISFLSVLMTYLGVNYLLSGMHSYGNANALAEIPIIAYLLFIAIFILPSLIVICKKKKIINKLR